MKIKAKTIHNRENGRMEWYISNKDNSQAYMISCNRKELDRFLLLHSFEEGTYEVFKYRSDEYWMFILGDDYNINIDYNKE